MRQHAQSTKQKFQLKVEYKKCNANKHVSMQHTHACSINCTWYNLYQSKHTQAHICTNNAYMFNCWNILKTLRRLCWPAVRRGWGWMVFLLGVVWRFMMLRGWVRVMWCFIMLLGWGWGYEWFMYKLMRGWSVFKMVLRGIVRCRLEMITAWRVSTSATMALLSKTSKNGPENDKLIG